VSIAHRPKDADLVKKSTEEAKKQYKEISGLESEVSFEDSLADDSAGGVIGSAMGDRIKVDNTLSARLRILEEKMLPELREDLFGKNPNRKFYTVSCARGRGLTPRSRKRYVSLVALDARKVAKTAAVACDGGEQEPELGY
jgi:hypothetical protein